MQIRAQLRANATGGATPTKNAPLQYHCIQSRFEEEPQMPAWFDSEMLGGVVLVLTMWLLDWAMGD